MRAVTKKAKAVKVLHIAKSLPVNKWFQKGLFSKLTGISMESCAVRLLVLTKHDQLERRGVPRLFEYRMNEEMQNLMIAQSIRDEFAHKGKRKNIEPSQFVRNINKAEKMAYKIKVDLMLRDMKFI